jgi:hypothetical protein
MHWSTRNSLESLFCAVCTLTPISFSAAVLASDPLRRCLIYFYLEDDTIHVAETRQENSGLPQGVFIKRHRIPKEGELDAFYGAADLGIGKEVTFYGRTFRIVNCDGFTRTFMEYLGVPMGESEELPPDPHTIYRNIIKENTKATRPTKALHDPLGQFLAWDRKVLRFNAHWDDSTNLFGDRREFTIFYFLADDTIEIVECIGSNSGRDPFPKFIRRQRIPRQFQGVIAFGAPQTYYSDRDLGVGASVDIFGRTFFIYNCDPFTSRYYDEKYSIKFRSVPMPQHQEVPIPRVRLYPPSLHPFPSPFLHLISGILFLLHIQQRQSA